MTKLQKIYELIKQIPTQDNTIPVIAKWNTSRNFIQILENIIEDKAINVFDIHRIQVKLCTIFLLSSFPLTRWIIALMRGKDINRIDLEDSIYNLTQLIERSSFKSKLTKPDEKGILNFHNSEEWKPFITNQMKNAFLTLNTVDVERRIKISFTGHVAYANVNNKIAICRTNGKYFAKNLDDIHLKALISYFDRKQIS